MKIIQNKDLKEYSYIKIGGKCKIFIEIHTINDFIESIKYCKKYDLKYKIIGCGSNIYFSEYFDGAILYNKYVSIVESDYYPIIYNKENKKDKIFIVSSGTILMDFINHCAKLGYDMSELSGIPGTVGGAVYNNAGAYGKEISDYFEGCTMIGEDNEVKIYGKNDVKFEYRESYLKKDKNYKDIIMNIFLKLPCKENKGEIEDKINEIVKTRNGKLPDYKNEPNIGCIFKNIYLNDSKIITGYLLEKMGGKKLKKGKLSIYKNHSNIVINKGNCSPDFMNNFTNEIKKKFFEKYGINLQYEVEYI